MHVWIRKRVETLLATQKSSKTPCRCGSKLYQPLNFAGFKVYFSIYQGSILDSVEPHPCRGVLVLGDSSAFFV